MPPLPDPRPSNTLKIKRREVKYSFWPVTRTTRRYGVQSRIFATNPWAIIRGAVNKDCPKAAKEQANAFREQAEDYFNAAKTAGLLAAKPVLLYYSFLNLAKTYVLTRGLRGIYGPAYHGLREKIGPGGVELEDSYLDAIPSGAAAVNVFDDFLAAVAGARLPGAVQYTLPHLMPQILQGHRLWCAAAGETERFIEISRIDIRQDSAARQIWINLNFYEDDITRLDVSHTVLLRNGRLAPLFSEVKGAEENGRRLVVFQQQTPVDYNHRPSDKLQEMVDTISPHIWSNVLSIPPYRKYYVYMAPNAEHPFVLPQILSIYALFYYFSSATRYKPERFARVISERHGTQIEEVITNLPNQFIFLMASLFAKQEVTRAAIV